MAKEISYYSLLVIALVYVVVPLMVNKFQRISVPIVVGEIIAGMIIGKSGFNLIQDNIWLNFLYNLGFAFLLFMAGVEINFGLIASSTRAKKAKWYQHPLILSLIVTVTTMSLSFLLAFLLYISGLIPNVMIIGIVFSATSVGVVVSILKEQDLLSSDYGQVILLSAMFSGFFTMVLLSVYVTLSSSNSIQDLFLMLLIIPIFFLFLKIGKIVRYFPIFEQLAHKNAQIKIRGAFALLMFFIVLAQALKTEIILAAFLAGLIVSLLNNRETSQIYLKLDAIAYGIFTPFFFVMVGVNFDIKDIIGNLASIRLLPILLCSVYFVRFISATLLKKSFSWRKSLGAAALLSSRLDLVIATSAIALKLGLIDGSLSGTLILLAILSCILSPLIFNYLVKPDS
ncbi:cation:proton antiporter [Paradesulfitobacterium aromaticivorans]